MELLSWVGLLLVGIWLLGLILRIGGFLTYWALRIGGVLFLIGLLR